MKNEGGDEKCPQNINIHSTEMKIVGSKATEVTNVAQDLTFKITDQQVRDFCAQWGLTAHNVNLVRTLISLLPDQHLQQDLAAARGELDKWHKRLPEIENHKATYQAVVKWECDNGGGEEILQSGDISIRLRKERDEAKAEAERLKEEVGHLILLWNREQGTGGFEPITTGQMYLEKCRQLATANSALERIQPFLYAHQHIGFEQNPNWVKEALTIIDGVLGKGKK